MLLLIADVMDIGKNIEAVHQKGILGISQHKNKIKLRKTERSLLYQSIFMRQYFNRNGEKMEIHCHYITILLRWQSYNEI